MSSEKQKQYRMIPENWKDIMDFEKMVQEKTGDSKAKFNANLFFFGNSDLRQILIPIKYRKPKKNGEFTDKFFEADVTITHCPFSGKPLYEEIKDSDAVLSDSKEMKTALEQFAIALYEKGLLTGDGDQIQGLLEEYKKVEKKQHFLTSEDWYYENRPMINWESFDQYWEQTFGGDE
jgi:hypothetical protein